MIEIAKLTEQEKNDWDELYKYIKKDILKYDDNIKLPKVLILRILGLKEGRFMANKNTKPMANYTFNQILMTFKLNKFDIVNSISNSSKFKNEEHKINYIMVIIEKNINTVVERLNKIKKSEEKGETIEINSNDDKAEYKKKTKEIKNSRLKGLL